MAVTPPVLYAALAASRASGGFPFAGINFDRLAWAIAYSVPLWFLAGGVKLQGTCIGTAGVGTINTPSSRLMLPSNPSLVIAGLSGAGMVGPLSASLGAVVALALSQVVTSSGQYAGGVIGVGVGLDVSKATLVDPPGLIVQLLSYMSVMLGPGPASAQMATGLGTGIASLALTITGAGNVVGAPSVAPGTGQSSSLVV